MPWVITNDKFFVRSDRRGCATPIVDKRRAKVFDERFNADEFLRSLPKAMKNLGYYVAPEDAGVEMRSIASQHPEVLSEPRRDLDLIEPGYYLESIGAFRGFIQDIQKARPKLEEQQIHAEMEIEDLLHAAEFYDLACDQGFDIYQRLREARIRRRNCKNAVAWIDFVLDANPDEFLRHDPSPRISGTQHRQYRPRALPELFEELSSLSYKSISNAILHWRYFRLQAYCHIGRDTKDISFLNEIARVNKIASANPALVFFLEAL